ncbi:erythrocyte membrane protein 1 [Plasmodium falciparum IGH-CR14]|uniref:Erythrocyte membrane protein 1 n=1 Tax=Plasmodium falciparum IGH-CR14 TaxID=580059 RepID=A0A0L1I4I2_PLAFA|nr:erythrocyte membrane protein 1 [Plasmodium falciparum IGH-CR14]
MAPGSTGTQEDRIDDTTAKRLLDSIGKIVHDQVKNGVAEKYKGELEGKLTDSSILDGELAGITDTCNLVKEYYKHLNGGGSGERNPCKGLSVINVERFSDTLGGQCTDSKIEGNKNNCGACAPFRRLHLCHHNLESIDTTSMTHKLLLEVCMAAKYEGNSIDTHYPQHKNTNNDSASQLCTVLARSFADIGDIVRGKDLFYGNPQEKEQREKLDEKLKTIFGKIHEGLKNEELKTRYNGDKENYYKLREDWWEANRETVWEAITCDVKSGNNYFRHTCGDEKTGTLTPNKCRCPKTSGANVDPPTYFDYVPQYLRWFEEWAEDFCRLRKRKLEDAKNKCRGKNGTERYCDLNRYDCTQTASGEKKFVEGKDCIGCHFSCSHFVKWIDNQKLEFLKQKKKYKTEISVGGGRKKRAAGGGSDHKGYEKIFYEKLKDSGYRSVESFLKKLNDEAICKKHPKVEDEKADRADFTKKDYGKTFDHTTYCQACPWCGAHKKDEKWEPKTQICGKEKNYHSQNITNIPILTPEKGKLGIVKKYNKFCNGNGGNGAPGTANVGARGGKGEKSANGKKDDQIETWQCYYDDSINDGEQNDNCVEGEWKDFIEGKKVKPYNVFFWDWVHDMLHDSVEWKTELSKCINNNTNGNTCRNNNKCKTDCGCFQKWVKQKEQEWTQIKDHFGKQKNILPVGDLAAMMTPDIVLKYVLQDGNLLQNIKDTHADAKDIERIEALLDEEKQKSKAEAGAGGVTEQKSIIVELLQHEKDEANKCKKNQEDCNRQLEEQRSRARSASEDDSPLPPADIEPDSEEDDEEEEAEDGSKEEEKEEKQEVDTDKKGEEKEPKEEGKSACEIVSDLFKVTNKFSDACGLKYGPKAPTSWKCVTPSGSDTGEATGEGSGSEAKRKGRSAGVPDGATTGSICVPPRRRKLYVTPLTKLTGGDGNTQSVGGDKDTQASQAQPEGAASQSPPASTSSTASPSPKGDALLTAFVESAAIETFFLWDRYKKEWEQRNKPQNGLLSAAQAAQPQLQVPGVTGDSNDPQNKLKSGTIPPDFLRQMFYTLGDYRDICVGNDVPNGGSDKEMADREKTIKDAISSYFSKSENQATGAENPGQTTKPEEWWNDTLGPAVWNGMICALTYKEIEVKNPDGKNTYKIEQIQDANGTHLFDTLKGKYSDYEKVKLDENSDTEAKTTGGANPLTASTSGENTTLNNPKLSDFVKRPPYFRYLEEWGETFCRKRKRMLEKIKEECRSEKTGHEYCSGDGHDCTKDGELKHKNMFDDLVCRDCHEQCRKYRKWIDIKFEEYHNQKNTYGKEHKKLKDNSKNDGDTKKFCQQIQQHTTAANFLESLNHCKPGDDDKDKNDEINFKQPLETFRHSKYCEMCPSYEVKCNGSNRRGKNPCTAVNGNGETWAKVFERISGNGEKTTKIDVHMIDRRGPFIEKYLENSKPSQNSNDLFKTSKLFKGIRKQNWTCKFNKEKKMDVCKLNKFKENIDLNEYTTFKVLLHYWLEDFIQGYYLLKKKKKIDLCTENGENTCDANSKNDCACVEKWIKQKTTEWEQIKDHYNKKEYGNGHDMAYKVTSYFEKYANDLIKGIDEYKRRKKIDEYEDCNGQNNCTSEDKKRKKDMVTLLLSRLQNEINKCPSSTSGNEQCTTPPSNLDDDDTPDEPLDDYYIQQPKICPPPMTCVEEIAKKLREDAERAIDKIKDKLKGNGTTFNGGCKMIKKNDTPGNGQESCDFKTTYENSVNNINNKCKDNRMERFKIGETWKCVKIYKIGKDICIPPRREHMCLDDLNTLGRSTVNDSTELLKKIQKVAKSEGDDIIKNLLPQNSCNENVICDAMKYSFADLGDIIRGRDLLNKNNKQKGIQKKIENTFENIYNKMGNDKNKYEKDRPKYLQLRSDWWDANRKAIWNAMTCNAPDAAKFLKKDTNDSSGTSSSKGIFSNDPKCGHQKDPPDYDYIPQPFRWMQEWSETFCKLLNEEIQKFETECKDCKSNGLSCQDDKNGKKCEKCKKQCKNYQELIDKWKLEFDKYKETYNELYNDKAKISSEEYFKKFLEKLKAECKEENTADKYLDKASHCKKYKFSNSENKNHNNYAFKHTPKDFEQACKCEAPDPLDQCPNNERNKGACKKLSVENECKNKNLINDDNWSAREVKDSTGNNEGVLVPPRRRHLCLRNITSNTKSINNKKIFKNELLKSAYSEGYYLWDKYKHDSTTLLDVMRYSFYDYGDIVKGTDMMDNYLLDQLKNKLNELLKENNDNEILKHRENWWEENKTHVWHAMICGYQERNGYKKINASWCTLPTEDNNSYQFLRWFREWTESFCFHRKKLYNIMVSKCNEAECDKTTGRISLPQCANACAQYRSYVWTKKNEYFSQKQKYDKDFKASNNKNDAPYYFRSTFFSKNYDCLFDNFNGDNKWKNPYESFNESTYKDKCDCQKTVPPPHVPPPPPPKSDELPAPADQPLDPTILQTTIPFGVALALGSIAFLFLKKKTHAPLDLFSVINIPKSDYDIPTKLSPNRYIPYTSGKYRGKRYIYLEGDSGTDSGYTDHYSDITSSESEYEEMDINDIYAPRAPKYKTLIEVVLEPSGKNTTASGKNTPSDTQNDIPTSDTPPPITDDEWNTLKHDFISNMLQNEPNTEPNDYSSGDIPFNTQPNTLYFDNNQEKPFITSIHDRDLYTGEEYNYDMSTNSGNNDLYNGKNNLYSGENNVYGGIDPTSDNRGPYSDKNDRISDNHHPYSGIDLINDTLSGNQHIDIYDELLKRKENELFGTNHTKKNTSTNSVAKNTNSDPIDNQLDLFHKWLDRHRDMCEKWENHHERLAKLKEEWENETHSGNIHTSDSNKTLNSDVSIQIHMDNPKPINQFNNMDTILEDLDKPFNEPYYYDMYDDDIYYDVHDHDTSTVDSNNMDVPSKVQIEMDINTKLVKEKYPIADVWDI